MSFKATVDIAVNVSYLKIRLLNRQGFIRYRMKIYFTRQKKQEDCHPYNILKGKTNKKKMHLDPQIITQSELDSDQQYYYSKLLQTRYRSDDIQQNQTIFFKAYLSVEEIDSAKFYCEVDCMFSEQPNENFQMIGKFKARIRKISSISTYLPISFDEFEGFTICSTFHAVIMEFKYDSSEQSQTKKSMVSTQNSCYDLWSYMDSITSGFNKEEVKQFYEYYRGFLQHELYKVQERQSELMKKQDKKEAYKFVKITKNKQIYKAMENMKSRKLITVSTSEQERLVQLIMNDFMSLKAHIYKKWMDFINYITQNSTFIANLYLSNYKEISNERFKNNVFSHRIKNHDWRFSKYEDSGKGHIEQACKEKKKISTENQLWNEHFPIENCRFFGTSQTHIKIFQEIYQTEKKIDLKNISTIKHIFVLVHGFQASRQDFALLKNCLEVNYNAQVFISSCNEGLTEESIVNLGKRLAIQLSKILVGNKKDYRLSFIGHSLGGLIIRAAIPYIKQFSDKFYAYISFSTPHLGYLYQPPTLIQAGLWIINTWQKCDSIQEISMKQNANLRETVLYNLSKNGSLNDFKKLCFIGSSQDEYVPYESARIEENRYLTKEKISHPESQIISEMVENILASVNCSQISRINVVFNIASKNLDSWIGRTGHIKFLSDSQFIKEFCCCFQKFFK